MTEMLDKVTDAIKAEIGRQMGATPLPVPNVDETKDWSARGDVGTIDLREVARVAMATMEEPTETMLKVGWEAMRGWGVSEYPRHIWRGMVRSVLGRQ